MAASRSSSGVPRPWPISRSSSPTVAASSRPIVVFISIRRLLPSVRSETCSVRTYVRSEGLGSQARWRNLWTASATIIRRAATAPTAAITRWRSRHDQAGWAPAGRAAGVTPTLASPAEASAPGTAGWWRSTARDGRSRRAAALAGGTGSGSRGPVPAGPRWANPQSSILPASAALSGLCRTTAMRVRPPRVAAAGQAMAGVVGEPGLDPDRAPVAEQEPGAGGEGVAAAAWRDEGRMALADDPGQPGVPEHGPGQDGQVEGGRAVAGGVEAVGVAPGGAAQPEPRRLGVHGQGEAGHRPTGRLGQHHGDVVGGHDQQGLEGLLDGELLPRFMARRRAGWAAAVLEATVTVSRSKLARTARAVSILVRLAGGAGRRLRRPQSTSPVAGSTRIAYLAQTFRSQAATGRSRAATRPRDNATSLSRGPRWGSVADRETWCARLSTAPATAGPGATAGSGATAGRGATVARTSRTRTARRGRGGATGCGGMAAAVSHRVTSRTRTSLRLRRVGFH